MCLCMGTALNCGVGRIPGVAGWVYISCLELSCNYLERHGDRALGSRKLLGHVTVDTHCYGCYVYTTIITIQSGVYSNTARAMGMTVTTCVLSNPYIDCWCSDHTRNIKFRLFLVPPHPKPPQPPDPISVKDFLFSLFQTITLTFTSRAMWHVDTCLL